MIDPNVDNADLPDLVITADSRHLWRIFDNLMGNICKYSQPGTRVYIDLATVDQCAQITFRNTSQYPLEQSTDALLERFVRGDSLSLVAVWSVDFAWNGMVHRADKPS